MRFKCMFCRFHTFNPMSDRKNPAACRRDRIQMFCGSVIPAHASVPEER
jgi:hypothetical protein